LDGATLNGAKALDMDEKLGSFEKGKMPGILIINDLVDKTVSNSSGVKRLL